MFLRPDNTIKWKFLLFASIITGVLCLGGIGFFDKPIFILLRNFNFDLWHIFEVIFDSKIWILLFGLLCIIFGIKFVLKSNDNLPKNIKKFNIKERIQDFIEKSKGNFAFLIFYSVLFSAVITGVLKFVIGRGRPVFFEALGQTIFIPFSNEWSFNSMPSGHSSASFAGLVMIGLLFPKYKWATWTLAILIGISRIAIGAHFPSDVILGAFIGMVSADLIKSKFSKKIEL